MSDQPGVVRTRTRAQAIVRGVAAALVLSFLPASLWPEASRTGTIIGGLLVWSEALVVGVTVTAAYWPFPHGPPRVLRFLAVNLLWVVAGTFALGWLILVPFSHNYGTDLLALFAAVVFILLGAFTRRSRSGRAQRS